MTEQSIYGSSRLGIQIVSSQQGYRSLGGKRFELSNHLGNVLAVVSDNIHQSSDSTWAEIINLTDYYPFGLAMEGRGYQNSLSYRYGFNGKENDLETGTQDYGFRIYDPKIAKFLSVDPLTKSFPMLTPYQFASNTPIVAIDLDGLEAEYYLNKRTNPENKKPVFLREGWGDVQKQNYQLTVQGMGKGIDEFYKDFSKDPTQFLNNDRAAFKIAYQQNEGGISKGDVLAIKIAAPAMNEVSVIVKSIIQNDGGFSVTFQTLKGHVEAGEITFTGTQKEDEINFDISSETRLNNWFIYKSAEGKARKEQKASWMQVLGTVSDYLGGNVVEKFGHSSTFEYSEPDWKDNYKGSEVQVGTTKANKDYHKER
ncbi:RHS repeat domain-containing protein [Litoribacter populi]|uniref:RHS repeat domain-containing protein n=1 Tax=Litoribacter populi TaxID=2598460 RepID=UPI00163DD3AF|nr:RHS repeat-associated core domain-containing protein [Litoribacter populi]